MSEEKQSPMMAQYHAIKREYPNEILFFRMGDFYEMMFEDAIQASEVLGITLTKRGRGTAAEAPMCGIPFHAAEGYIAKIIQQGLRVAICDQVEDPKASKGLVKREVTRVITPGTVLDENCMDHKDFQYLASVIDDGKGLGIAFLEFSTGLFEVLELRGEDRFVEMADLFVAKNPAELLLDQKLQLDWMDSSFLKNRCITRIEDWYFGKDYARQQLLDHFETLSLAGFGLDDLPLALRAAGASLSYIHQTQKSKASHIGAIRVISRNQYLALDASTIRNLELTRSMFDGNRRESLLGVMDHCKTAMGSRLLKDWLLQPLTEVPKIRERQAYITSHITATIARNEIRKQLSGLPDLDRQFSKLAIGTVNPRELQGMAQSLAVIPDLLQFIDEVVPDRYGLEDDLLTRLWEMHTDVSKVLVSEPPTHQRDGGMIGEGVDEELDELRSLKRDSQTILAKLETREREATQIPKLKVQYNRVFGYYIEIGNLHKEKVPAHYVRKQTLANCERYITDELKRYEEKILGAEEKILVIEQRLFAELVKRGQARLADLRAWSQTLALLDVHAGLAELAVQKNYCLPQVNEGSEILIQEGRHPVVESLSSEPFIPNDTFLNAATDRLMIITGPNMGGKSTYLRQVALISLMAQVGSYVPAARVELGVVDRIFTRVGASDHLARGHSTFMVEMTETANILNHASAKSLIILDEIGRGTSTFDGLSLAWAIAEYIHDLNQIGAKTLFATHYHELTDLVKICEGVTNFHITVREWNNRIVFLRRIERGAADQSYGIHVAQLAGLPGAVIKRAREILRNLEKNELDTMGQPRIARRIGKKETRVEPLQMSLFGPEPSPVLDELRALELDQLAPRQAMDLLYKWKEML